MHRVYSVYYNKPSRLDACPSATREGKNFNTHFWAAYDYTRRFFSSKLHSSFFFLQFTLAVFFFRITRDVFFRDDAIITRDIFSMQYYTRRFFNAIIIHATFFQCNNQPRSQGFSLFVIGKSILVPRALLTRGQPSATRGSGQIQTGYHKNMVSG